jgi:hypothetical protein
MFFIELNINIPYESPEQPMLTRDYPLLKRRLIFFLKNFSIIRNFSVLQRVRGNATIGLCYINPTTSVPQTNSTENDNTVQNEVRLFFSLERK